MVALQSASALDHLSIHLFADTIALDSRVYKYLSDFFLQAAESQRKKFLTTNQDCMEVN